MPAVGTWQALTNINSAEGLGTMELLSNGTVLANGGNISSNWYTLTPDSSGSYLNSTWTAIPSMSSTRLYYFSGLLNDGRLFVAGGEYGTGTNTAEIYDPVANTWTSAPNSPQGDIGDTAGMVLDNGQVFLGDRQSAVCRIYDPGTNSWLSAASNNAGISASEVSWARLPNGDILDPNIGSTAVQKYIPSTNTWVSDTAAPVTLGDSVNFEMGALTLLYDGRAFAIGGSGHTALYTQGATPSAPGSWTAGPDILRHLTPDDAPAAVMPNGHVLTVADHNNYNGPNAFFEYNPGTNKINNVSEPSSADSSNPSYVFRMLVLPTGQVLLTDGSQQAFIYTPVGSPNGAWRPQITGITPNTDGSFTVNGTQLTGRTEGAYYGDDAAMSTNYPLVRLTSVGGQVYYARTYNFSTREVATGSTPETARFTLPAGIPSGTYKLVVVTNGIASASKNFTVGPAPDLAQALGNQHSAVATAAPANLSSPISMDAARTAIPAPGSVAQTNLGERPALYVLATESTRATEVDAVFTDAVGVKSLGILTLN